MTTTSRPPRTLRLRAGKAYPGLTDSAIAVTLAWLRQLDDELADLERQGAEKGLVPVCRPGCAACCTYLVGALSTEAALVAAQIDDLPIPQQAGVIARLVAWEREWHLTYGRADLIHPQQALAWQMKRLPCPMLDPKRFTCLVYATRPLACRTHHALPPPEGDRGPCSPCGVVDPPEGCFQTQQATDHGHPVVTWMLDNLLEVKTAELLQLLLRLEDKELGVPEPGHLPTLVLKIGRVKYGWRNPPKVVRLPVMQHATAR